MAGIYIHIPFCKSKCDYCDFFSVSHKKGLEADYMRLLQKQITDNNRGLANTYKSIYFGGGTPSVLSVKKIDEILQGLYKHYKIDENAEITLEGNPGDFVSIERVKQYKQLGINRLSVGIQTMNDNPLKLIGRRQSVAKGLKALDNIAKTFDNFSVDVMAGLPEENLQDLFNTLKVAINAGVKHISLYALKVEADTKLAEVVALGQVSIPDADTVADIYKCAAEFLEDAGLKRYEVSNFCLSGFESQHNLNYWQRGQYLGFGAAAHGFIDGVRYSNFADLQEYSQQIEGKLPKAQEKVAKVDALFEKIMLGLRLTKGINIHEINTEFDIDFFAEYSKALKKHEGHLNISADNVSVKGEYMYVLNSILVDFLD